MRASMCVAGGWNTRQTAGSVALCATACANHRVERAVFSQSTPSANTNRVEGGRGNRRSGFNNASAVRQRGGCSPSDRRFRSAVDRSVTLMLSKCDIITRWFTITYKLYFVLARARGPSTHGAIIASNRDNSGGVRPFLQSLWCGSSQLSSRVWGALHRATRVAY